MEESNETAEGTTETELVAISDASDEDLDAFLSNASESTGEEEVTEEVQPEAKETEPKREPEKEEAPLSKEDYERLQAEHEKLKAHVKNVELWNAKQGTEIGELRKAIRETIAKKSENLDERLLQEPKAAYKDLADIEKAEEQLRELDDQEAMQQHVARTFEVVSQHIPEADFDPQAMAICLAADGLEQSFIKEFLNNPFAQAHGETIIQLNKRAIAEKQRNEAAGIIKKLVGEVERLRSKSKNVIQGVERASRATPQITASNGGAQPNGRPSLKSPALMSDTELEEFLKSNN